MILETNSNTLPSPTYTDMEKCEGSVNPTFKPFSVTNRAAFSESLKLYDRKIREWVEDLAVDYRKKSKGDLVGEVIRFPVADGCAQYMITKHNPFTMVHLAIGDCWHVQDYTIRGFRITDARAQVNRNRELSRSYKLRKS